MFACSLPLVHWSGNIFPRIPTTIWLWHPFFTGVCRIFVRKVVEQEAIVTTHDRSDPWIQNDFCVRKHTVILRQASSVRYPSSLYSLRSTLQTEVQTEVASWHPPTLTLENSLSHTHTRLSPFCLTDPDAQTNSNSQASPSFQELQIHWVIIPPSMELNSLVYLRR